MKPQKLDRLIEEVLNKKKIGKGLRKIEIFRAFKKCAGEKINEFCMPYDFKRNILYIKVKSSAFLNEIYFLKEELLKRINLNLENNFVKEIKFFVREE